MPFADCAAPSAGDWLVHCPGLQVSIDQGGLMKVTHMLNLQLAPHETVEVSNPIASFMESQVGIRGLLQSRGALCTLVCHVGAARLGLRLHVP